MQTKKTFDYQQQNELQPSGHVLGGKKFDTDKPPIGLIPREAIETEARVLGFGAAKYGRYNWQEGIAYSRNLDAALRHIFAYTGGESLDPESGLSHLAHARCCLGFVIWHETHRPDCDDRATERTDNAGTV